MKTYLCIVCGFVYDEAAGRPEDGIAAGTYWYEIQRTTGGEVKTLICGPLIVVGDTADS